jgi:hypothetical protein
MLPSKFDASPKSHSARKYIDSPEVERSWKFLTICGTCAKSHERIEHMPRTVDTSPSVEGIHMSNVTDIQRRNGVEGSQWAGSEAAFAAMSHMFGGFKEWLV